MFGNFLVLFMKMKSGEFILNGIKEGEGIVDQLANTVRSQNYLGRGYSYSIYPGTIADFDEIKI